MQDSQLWVFTLSLSKKMNLSVIQKYPSLLLSMLESREKELTVFESELMDIRQLIAIISEKQPNSEGMSTPDLSPTPSHTKDIIPEVYNKNWVWEQKIVHVLRGGKKLTTSNIVKRLVELETGLDRKKTTKTVSTIVGKGIKAGDVFFYEMANGIAHRLYGLRADLDRTDILEY